MLNNVNSILQPKKQIIKNYTLLLLPCCISLLVQTLTIGTCLPNAIAQGVPQQTAPLAAKAGLPAHPVPLRAPSATASLHPPVATTGLTVVPDGANHAAVSPRSRAAYLPGAYDFGQISVLDVNRIEHIFTLRNDSKNPLTLTRLQPSCACTTATIVAPGNRAASGAALPTLAPGQQVSILVTVAPERVAAGLLTKSVLVFVKDVPQPAAILAVTGLLRPAATFSPPMADFGQIKTGDTHSVVLTATLDSRLTVGNAMPLLVSNNPAVQITPGPAVRQAAPSPAKTGSAALPATPPVVVRSYTLRLVKNPPLGPLLGAVSFVPLVSGKATGVSDTSTAAATSGAAESRAAVLLASVSARLTGQVTGDVAAMPGVLAFGTVHFGQESRRQVSLSGTGDAALKNILIASASPWLSAKVGGVPSASVLTTATAAVTGAAPAPSLTRTLDVRLSPNAPPGLLQTQLKVVLGNGQRLLIPVSAYVSTNSNY